MSNPKQVKIQKAKIKNTQTKKSENYMSSYITINKNFLDIGDKLDFSLYEERQPTHMTVFLQSNSVLDKNKQKRLQEIEDIFAHKYEEYKYEQLIDVKLQNFIKDDSKTIDEKTDAIYTSNTEIVHSLYENPDALENAQRSKKIVAPIVNSVVNNKNIISSYMKIISYDYYTYTHSLNVSIYALCLGANLNLDKQTLKKLGQSALLHDIGKSKVNPEIVNKDGSLTEDEFNTIKKHPLYGYNIAIKMDIEDNEILHGIRHHHEKINGMGYPDHLKNNEITLFPRIIAICDVFDALTTRRSYKDAMKSFEALSIMKKEMTNHLDMKILNVFIKMLAN